MSRKDTSAERTPRDVAAQASTEPDSPELPESAAQEGRKVRRLVLEARDRAAEPVRKRLRQDREDAPQKLESLLTHVDEHLFDADLTVKTALKATHGNWDLATLARGYLGVPLREYFRAAQIETARGLPPVLWRGYGLRAPTGEIAAAVGLPVLKSFCNWHVHVRGEPPEILVWPGLLPPGLDDYTRNRIARGKRRPGDFAALLAELAGIEAEDPDFDESLLEDLEPLERAKAETVRRIHRDEDSLPDHLKPLLGYIAKNIFHGLNATVAISKSEIGDKENVGEQLRFHLGETVKSYLTKRWVETFASAVAESDLNIETIFRSLGQDSKRTVYRWFVQHTGENPGDLRRFGSAAEELVDAETWRLAGHGVPSAVAAVKDCLRAIAEAEGSDAELLAPAVGAEDDGTLARLESDIRAHPILAASVAIDRMSRDPGLIHDCLRAALDSSHRARLFGRLRDPDIGSSELAQIAYSAAQARLRKTREPGVGLERYLTGDVELEQERVALAELVFGVALLGDSPSDQAVLDGLTLLRASLDKLANSTDSLIRRFLAESRISILMVRECLCRSVEMGFTSRTEAVAIACEAFDKGLLNEESHPDEYRWAVASKANLARIITDYTGARELLATINLNQPFTDMVVAGTVRWIAGVIQAESGDWEAAQRSLAEALLFIDATKEHTTATKIRVSRALILLHCGDDSAYAEFRACLERAVGDPALQFWAMVNLIITKCYCSLDVTLPFAFEDFVAVAKRSAQTKAWIPYCMALMEERSGVALALFLSASQEFEETTQILPASISSLFAAREAAKVGRLPEAYQLGVKAAMSFKASQAFGGRLALAAEAFLTDLRFETGLVEKIHTFLRRVQTPYRCSDEG